MKIKVRKEIRTPNILKAPSLRGEQNEWEYHSFETPRVKEGQRYAEFKTSFELKAADINWDIVGWSESEDLRQVPKLKQEVIAFYKMYMQVIEKRDAQAYIKMIEYNSYEHILSEPWHMQEMYESIQKHNLDEILSEPWHVKEMLDATYESVAEDIKIKQKFIFPLAEDKLELKYYGEGRVVTLVSTDPKSYGYSPLIAREAEHNFPMAHTFYLHRPKGSKDLEIIR